MISLIVKVDRLPQVSLTSLEDQKLFYRSMLFLASYQLSVTWTLANDFVNNSHSPHMASPPYFIHILWHKNKLNQSSYLILPKLYCHYKLYETYKKIFHSESFTMHICSIRYEHHFVAVFDVVMIGLPVIKLFHRGYFTIVPEPEN